MPDDNPRHKYLSLRLTCESVPDLISVADATSQLLSLAESGYRLYCYIVLRDCSDNSPAKQQTNSLATSPRYHLHVNFQSLGVLCVSVVD